LAYTPEGINLTTTSDGYNVDFQIPQYTLNTIIAEDEEYLNLSIDGYGVSPEAGFPSLPLISFNLFIAEDETEPGLNIIISKTTQVFLQSKIFPVQEPWIKSNPFSERPFFINREFYHSSGKENYQIVSISEPFVIAGVKGVRVTINPFNYNPSENKLFVISSLNFEIILKSTIPAGYVKSESTNSLLQNVFTNYDGANGGGSKNYLIISAPEFEQSMSSFVNHKAANGYNVEIYSTNSMGTGAADIKNFIQQKYDNTDTRPEFVLLVGDVSAIPAWTGSGSGSPNTDLNYVLLEGNDYFADAFIGRFSVASIEELQNTITKSIFMENYAGAFERNNVFMASTDNWQTTEASHNNVINNYFDPAGYSNTKLYTYSYNATTQDFINELNGNKIFAVYSGHGSETAWLDGPPVNQQLVRELTNTVFPFVFSFACVTGSYHVNEGFGETWLRSENGASTFYGSSVDSYWEEDDILEQNVFQSMFEDENASVSTMFLQGMMKLVNHYGGINPTMIRYLEMYNLMGDPSMPVKKEIQPDTTPPGTISDLETLNPTSNSITLNWTAPFDSSLGGVVKYDIRYSTFMINNNDDFNNASQKMLSGQTDTAGTYKSFAVNTLDFSTTYYFAIKAIDIWGNESELSNVPSLQTYQAPELSIDKDSVKIIVEQNVTHTDSIVITNSSLNLSTLEYNITLTNNTFPDNTIVSVIGLNETLVTAITGSKEEPVTRYGFSNKGAGGPDSFGYLWKDSNDPDGPEFIWNDITGSTNAHQVTAWLGNKDDGITEAIPIGFNFDFYGNSFSEIFISTNGFVSLENMLIAHALNEPVPFAEEPNNIICPLWDDLDGRFQGTVHYLQEADRFTVQFTNWKPFYGTGSYTFQVVLKSNNRIYFYYKNLSGVLTTSTVGIENSYGSDGLQMTYNAVYLENNLAVTIYTEPEWITPNHFSGTLYNGTSAAILFNVNTQDLELGEYSMDILLTSNDPNAHEIIIPVSMIITNDLPTEVNTDSNVPTEFALSQNYPNPFNPSTTIKFALPDATQLTICVYNSIGEKITEIFSGNLAAGYHSIDFNASSLASGVYFYRFESDTFVDVKKMLLLR
jgi:hypothetical protein